MTILRGQDFIVRQVLKLIDGACAGCGRDLLTVDNRPHFYTCSEPCQEAWFRRIIEEEGEYKTITEVASGRSYCVPTLFILRHGIRGSDLPKFPQLTKRRSAHDR